MANVMLMVEIDHRDIYHEINERNVILYDPSPNTSWFEGALS